MSVYCKNCGKENNENSKFCSRCGTPLIINQTVTTEQNKKTKAKQKKKAKAEQNPNSKKNNKIKIILIISAIVLACVGIIIGIFFFLKGFKKSNNVVLENFSSSEIYFLANYEDSVTFTVEAKDVSEKIILINESNDELGEMNDNGVKGDVTAKDGIYSLTISVYNSKEATAFYSAKSGDKVSNSASIYFFKPTEDSKDIAENVKIEMKKIENKYVDGEGYVPQEKISEVISEVVNYCETLNEDGTVFSYEANQDNVVVKFASGYTMVYMPSVKGYDSIGDDVSMSIYTFQPCLEGYGDFSENYIPYPLGITEAMRIPDTAAATIAGEYDNYSFTDSNNYDDEEVTLERIKSIKSNQIIAWHGHGGYSQKYHSFILTGDSFNWLTWLQHPIYYLDNIRGYIIEATNGKLCITHKFVSAYCKDLNNTMIYLAACCSGKDDALANAFINNGAAAVVANNETILTLYNLIMEYTVLSTMTEVNENTGNYYTLGESLNQAKETYGETDAEYRGKGACPVIFGNDSPENYRFGDVKPGTLSGKICKASDRVTVIPNASIEIYRDGNLHTSAKSDASGNYAISLPVGTYFVKISSAGYIDFNAYATVESNENTYMETFLLVEGSETDTGIASGKIINSLSGTGAPDVTLSIRKDWNNTNENAEIIKTTVSDSDGNYSIELPLGNYTVAVSKEGYSPSTFNIVVQAGTTNNQDGTITPIISGNNYLITLTWDENPRDLDSHVVGTLNSGDEFHVFFSHKSQNDGNDVVCNLDYDDTDSYGPEHITLTETTDKPYYYYIHRYAGSGAINTSGAQITVEQGNVLIAKFNVPTDLGPDDYWNVFAIKNGQIIVNNTITSTPDISYAE